MGFLWLLGFGFAGTGPALACPGIEAGTCDSPSRAESPIALDAVSRLAAACKARGGRFVLEEQALVQVESGRARSDIGWALDERWISCSDRPICAPADCALVLLVGPAGRERAVLRGPYEAFEPWRDGWSRGLRARRRECDGPQCWDHFTWRGRALEPRPQP